jgi:hypothetical protein
MPSPELGAGPIPELSGSPNPLPSGMPSPELGAGPSSAGPLLLQAATVPITMLEKIKMRIAIFTILFILLPQILI